MKNQYLKKWRLLSVLFLIMCLSPHMLVRAQSTANYAFSTNTTGSLGLDMNGNTVDMSTGTTQVLASNTSQDQVINSTAISFGFNFPFASNTYSGYFATSNGLVQLGTTAVISGSTYSAAGGTLAAPRFSAFDGDLGTGTTGGIFGKLVGTAPNRCYVIEFRNMTQMWTSSYTNDGTYQVRFYESTGVIEYVYGSMFCTSTASAGDATPEVGFSWGSAVNQSMSINISTSATDVSGTMIQNTMTAGANITNLHSTTNGSRRIYRWTPPGIPTTPTSMAFNTVGPYGMNVTWVDNSTTEYAYMVYKSTDGVTYNLVATLAANSTSYFAGSLTPSTTYFWKVTAISEIGVSTPDLLGSQATSAVGSSTLSGIKTVGAGGDYNNLTTAFNTINAQGLVGDIELQLITGYPAAPETYPIQSSNTVAVGAFNVKVYPTVSGLSITSANTTGTLNLNNAKNLTFDGRVNQTGSNDLVIANTNAGTSYAILFNNDAQNNTIKNAIVQSVNTSTSSGTIVFGTTTGTNGNDNNTIDNCDIRDGATTPTNGIYSVGSTGTAAQFNDNNIISNNRISNFFNAGSSTIGVYVGSGNSTWTINNNKLFQTATRTYTSGSTHNGIQISNTSGNGFVISGNTIGYASAAGTGVYTIAGAVTNRFIGINVSAGTTTASSVQGNTISGFNLTTSSGAAANNGVFAGIHITNGNVNVGNITPNTIGGTTGTGAIAVTSSSTGALVVGVNSSSSGTVNISNNLIGSITASGSSATVSAGITGIQVSAGTPTINGNTIGSTTTANSISSPTVSTSGTGQLIRGIDVTSGVTSATSIQSNTIANMSGAGNGTSTNARGISYAGTGLATISLNTIYAIATAGTATSSNVGILHSGAATGGAVVNKNTIYTLTNTNTGANQVNVIGISYAGPTAGSVTNNTIYDLQNASTMTTATTPPVAAGILLQSVVTSVNVSNNMISVGNAQTTNTEFIGIWNNTTSTGNLNIYHNSISISGTASSGALPTYGIIRGSNGTTAITSPVDMRNNIVSNLRSGGTGKHYAIANQSSTASTTGWGLNASNYNVLNTATAATVGLWGATDETFNAWRVAANSDANSFSAIPLTFVDITTANLHLNMGVTATPIESGGAPIASVTTDFDNQTRPGPSGSVNGGATAPDLGADEFDGVPALPVITLNSVTPPASTQCTATARVVSVNITTPVGTIVSANIGYTVNGVAQTPITMTNSSGTTWTGTIPAASPVNATIAWGVSATNSSGLTGSYIGTAYSDTPLLGVTAAATNNASIICAGSPSSLSATLTKPGPVTLGAGASTTSGSGSSGGNYVSPFSHYFGGYKAQYVVRASELTAAGLSAGNITSLAFDVTTAGTTYNSFTLSISPTAATVANATFITGTFTDVYSGNLNVATTGLNTITFTTPFNWDGTSNIIVQLCWSNNNTGGTAAEVKYDATSFVSQAYYRADSQTPATICGTTAATSTQSNRPKMVLTGNVTFPFSAISWSDGASTVGTTNPLTVNPTTTTTYTANITAAGCTVTPAPTTTVTVNPLPSAPTATNSAQCGTQIPTASVASTSGLPTPTFVWYSAATGGTVMQSGASTTYTSNVTSTTTFYVAEKNNSTGCESARTAVTVTVAIADGIQASVDNATICIGATINLSVVNTNPTPLQNYTYTWAGTAGSGVTSQGGTPIAVTPTLPGTYTYNVSAVDGGCNAVSSVNVTVNPFTSTVTPINVTCNGYNNGSFSQGAVSCGTAASYSVDGGAFGPIPTNLTPGTHTVVTMNTGGFTSTSQTITITEPSTVINAPTGTNIAVCQNSSSAMVSATGSVTPATSTFTQVVSFNVATQPTENSATSVPTVAASPNVIATATMTALPAGAVITGGTLNYNGITALSSSWMSDVRLGLTGAATQDYTGGTGAGSSAGTFNYTAPVAAASINTAGGSISLHYFDFYSDNAGAEATFPTGAGVASLTITYTVPNTPTISWWNASTGGTQIGTGSPFETVGTSVLPNTTTPGVYTVYAQGEFSGCSGLSRTAVTVTVNALPTVNAGTDQTVCSGSSVTLNGSGATSYTWNNGVTNGTPFTATATTTYTVTGTDANGCQNTDAVLVTVNTLPAVNAGADQAICTGSSVTLSGSGATSYSWNNGVTDGVAFTPSATTTYTVTGTDANGCQNADAVVVTVNTLPTVSAGADQAICPGSSVTLNGSGAVSYSWDNGVTNGTPFTPSATTTYTVTGTDANGCQNTDAVVVTVNTLPTVSAGADQAVCSGSSVTLNGSGAVSYTWDNGVTDGTPFSATATATYTVTGTDVNGCQNTDAVVVTVNTLPTVNAGADQAVCSGSSVTLNGSGAVSYTWDNGVTDGTPFTPSATTTYTVTGTDANGCQNTDAVVVTVNTLPAVSAGADQASCSGSSVTLSGSGAVSYSWDNGVTDGVAFTPSVTATYTVTGTDANGCQNTDVAVVTVGTLPTVSAGADQAVCSGSSVTLNGSGAVTYSWDNGVTDGTPFTATATTTYTVTGTDANGCQNTDAVVVTVNALPTVNAGADQAVCSGSSVTLNGSGAVSYSWDNGVTNGTPFTPSATTTYTVTGTDANGCQNTDAVVVTVNTLPTVSAGADQAVCSGSSVTLNGSGAVSYSWDNGVTNGTPFTPSATTTYTVTGTDANGCQNTDAVVVTVNTLPTATATDNGNATITASSGNGYQWINCATGTAIAGATAQTFAPAANGSYAVVVSNASGCTDTSACVTINNVGIKENTTVSISVYPNPTHNEVTITMTASSANVEVVDAQGKLLQTTQVISGGKVDLSAYETGVYFLRIQTENGSTLERIVKN